MEFESFKRYRAIVSGPGVEVNLDTPDVSYEVSYLTSGDVDTKKGGVPDELRDSEDPETRKDTFSDERRGLNDEWKKSAWSDRGSQWGTAEVRLGVEVIVQYMSNGLFHVMGSDSPDCVRIVGEANVENLRDFRDLSAAPKYRNTGRQLAQQGKSAFSHS